MALDLQELDTESRRTVARRALATIKDENENKLLVADDVVSAASEEDHPLHKYFEWDNSVAGHKYRLFQARQLIRTVEVVMPDKDHATVPKYVSLRADRDKRKGGGYRDTSEVIHSADLLAELEQTAKRDIDGVLQRYEMLTDLVKKVRKAAGIVKRAKK